MYYLFRSTWKVLKSKDYYAKLETKLPSLVDMWTGKPLVPDLPPLKFSVPPDAKFFDNFVTGTSFDLYSKKLIELMREQDINFETFNATIINRKNGEEFQDKYYVFHLLEPFDVFDQKRSSVSLKGEILVPSSALKASNKPMLRDSKFRSKVVVHESLKNSLEQNSVTGCDFIPLNI